MKYLTKPVRAILTTEEAESVEAGDPNTEEGAVWGPPWNGEDAASAPPNRDGPDEGAIPNTEFSAEVANANPVGWLSEAALNTDDGGSEVPPKMLCEELLAGAKPNSEEELALPKREPPDWLKMEEVLSPCPNEGAVVQTEVVCAKSERLSAGVPNWDLALSATEPDVVDPPNTDGALVFWPNNDDDEFVWFNSEDTDVNSEVAWFDDDTDVNAVWLVLVWLIEDGWLAAGSGIEALEVGATNAEMLGADDTFAGCFTNKDVPLAKDVLNDGWLTMEAVVLTEPKIEVFKLVLANIELPVAGCPNINDALTAVGCAETVLANEAAGEVTCGWADERLTVDGKLKSDEVFEVDAVTGWALCPKLRLSGNDGDAKFTDEVGGICPKIPKGALDVNDPEVEVEEVSFKICADKIGLEANIFPSLAEELTVLDWVTIELGSSLLIGEEESVRLWFEDPSEASAICKEGNFSSLNCAIEEMGEWETAVGAPLVLNEVRALKRELDESVALLKRLELLREGLSFDSATLLGVNIPNKGGLLSCVTEESAAGTADPLVLIDKDAVLLTPPKLGTLWLKNKFGDDENDCMEDVCKEAVLELNGTCDVPNVNKELVVLSEVAFELSTIVVDGNWFFVKEKLDVVRVPSEGSFFKLILFWRLRVDAAFELSSPGILSIKEHNAVKAGDEVTLTGLFSGEISS